MTCCPAFLKCWVFQGVPLKSSGDPSSVEAGDLALGIVKCIMDPRSRNQDTFLHGHGAFENQYKMEDLLWIPIQISLKSH